MQYVAFHITNDVLFGNLVCLVRPYPHVALEFSVHFQSVHVWLVRLVDHYWLVGVDDLARDVDSGCVQECVQVEFG